MHRLLYLIGLRPNPDPRTFQISESFHLELVTLAKHAGRPEHDLIPELLAVGLTQYAAQDLLRIKWKSLSAREQEVTALICLDYNRIQIADMLGVSPGTVKTHTESIYNTFEVHTAKHLAKLLEGWDMAGWWDTHPQ
ncbi:MAG: helix-turn-helix transcriptional regulator [Chloroflexi bacterium]|nr:helix-turn-helix transcriptional regulator [Chloroflexota bacterium]